MMDIADKYGVTLSFFLDFAECEVYGDSISDVGGYILSRGHELHVHCHYDLLSRIVGKKSWLSAQDNYYSWYKDYNTSLKIIDYVTNKYVNVAHCNPTSFRGGEYRIGKGQIKALKNFDYKADFTYNCLRPYPGEAMGEFKFENDIMEMPIGNLPNSSPLSFNYRDLMPESEDDFDKCFGEYTKSIKKIESNYGHDACTSIILHSWSFLYDKKRFENSGFFDTPNTCLTDFFDYMISSLKKQHSLITVSDWVKNTDCDKLQTVSFDDFFKNENLYSKQNLSKISDYINKKAVGKKIIVWGRGWMESAIFSSFDLNKCLYIAFYLSADAGRYPVHRGKPVYTYDNMKDNITNHGYYVLVVAQSSYTDIRKNLNEKHFVPYEDYFDFAAFSLDKINI